MTGPNHGNPNLIEYRRKLVAGLLVRRPNIQQRDIMDAVGKQVLNPQTDRPYSLGTINNDIQAIRAGWRERAGLDYDEWVAEQIATLDEVETEAWLSKNFELVLKCMDRRAKLLGLDKPQQLIVTWRERARDAGLDPDALVESLAEEFAALMREGAE